MQGIFDSLVNLIINKLLKDNSIQEEEREIYQFGVEVTILKVLHTVSYFTIALCLGKVMEFFMIFGVFHIFRCNTGGFHAKTRLKCYFFSCFMMLLAMLSAGLSVNLQVPVWLMNSLLIAELIIIIRISPVENENRSLDQEEITYFRKRLYITSFVFIILFLLIEYLQLPYLLWLSIIGLTLDTILTIMGKIQYRRNMRKL